MASNPQDVSGTLTRLRDGRVLAFGAVFSLLILITALTPSTSEPESLGTSIHYGFAGHRAFYEFLGEIGHSPERLRVSPAGLGDREGTLWMIRPNDQLLVNNQMALFDLGEWVEAGNHLVLVMGDSQLNPLWFEQLQELVDAHKDDTPTEDTPTDEASPTETSTDGDTFESGLALLSEALGVPLARSVDGEELTGRGVLESPDGAQAEITIEGFMPLALPYGAEVLWSLDGEPVILRSAVGEGTVTWVENGDLIVNEHIGEGDHAWLLAGLMVDDGPVYVDEFFHGLPEYLSLGDVLLRPPFRMVTLQGFFLLALGLWFMIPRFGAPRDPVPTSRRQKREHIEAMANLLARADDGTFLIQETCQFILADARSRLGLSPQTPVAIVLDGLRSRRPQLATDLQQLLDDGRDHTLRGNTPSLLAWGRRADTLRSTLQEVQH